MSEKQSHDIAAPGRELWSSAAAHEALIRKCERMAKWLRAEVGPHDPRLARRGFSTLATGKPSPTEY